MIEKQRTISILGSTGSIGKQTLDVLNSIEPKFKINYLTVNSKIDKLAEQIKKYSPLGIAIRNEKAYKQFKEKYSFSGKILCGEEGIIEAASDSQNDIICSALVGFSGVKPTLAAIENNITVALANKETLVSAGCVISKTAKDKNVKIIAVDSEHSAIMQCLIGEEQNAIEKLILTASGGPFFNKSLKEFKEFTVEEALSHPNWNMGSKITIDSATMMNKGFEVIEAYWLFGVEADKIDVVIHPQSIVHSLVQFVDGSVKAQLGLPDMRLPISFALSYPKRLPYPFERLNLAKIRKLEFHEPDHEKFPCLNLAYQALKIGGTAPAVLNAANEVAVNAFLNKKIGFVQIQEIIDKSLNKIDLCPNPSICDIFSKDKETRNYVENLIERRI